jgi:hypothetical protein
MRLVCSILCLLAATSGCTLLPNVAQQPLYHNPFPQLTRVAVLPFYNQSADPTVNSDQIALAYYNELQQVPGFEVMPVGVAKQIVLASGIEPQTSADFQKLALYMDVDAIVVGSVTDFSPYYPPRMSLAVNWYAANPCFHPIPPGYALPWGSKEERQLSDSQVFEAEFALAREQLKTQTPQSQPADEREPPPWPDPRGFVPPPPSDKPLECSPHDGPIISLVRTYNGHDADFTRQLANYYRFRDDARFGGWQAYLQRKEDFVRFCCYLHITETLSARGGTGETRVVWRWPFSRYQQ